MKNMKKTILKISLLSLVLIGCLAPQQASAMNLKKIAFWAGVGTVTIVGLRYALRSYYQDYSLLFAIRNGNNKEARAIIQNRPELINVQNSYGITPLIAAIIYNLPEIARLLIESGADLDLQNNKGATPLMYAIDYSYPELAFLLIKKGADISIEDNQGYTAFDDADKRRYKNLAALLDKLEDFPQEKEKAYTLFKEDNAGNDLFAVPALRMIYKNKKYLIDVMQCLALFQKTEHGNETLKNLIKECEFLRWNKEEFKKISKTTGLPLTVEDLMMQQNLIHHTKNFDINIAYN